ncbi:MAG: YdjY domain-containing protein [Desulfobacula sp.]|nr:YdjY domain-containing protein [Desulfobacula sp.]
MKRLPMILMLCLFVTMTTMTPPVFSEETNTVKNSADSDKQPVPLPGRDAPLWDKNKNKGNKASSPPPIQKVEDGIFRVGNITVNKREEYVLVDGEVNQQDGIVEYLACGEAGKLHESVLKLIAEPFDLQIAMLLLGLEPGINRFKQQGHQGIPEGDSIEIWVSWINPEKKLVTYRAEDLLLDKRTDQSMEKTHWIYTGSQIVNGRFMAQVEQSIVATYHDPYAMIGHPLPSGEDDTRYWANKNVLPPKGMPVKFRIRKSAP